MPIKRSKRKKRFAPKRSKQRSKSPKKSKTPSLDWPVYKDVEFKALQPNPKTKRDKLFFMLGMMAKMNKQFQKDIAKYSENKKFFNP